jgi:exonuclease SbcD
MPRFKIAHTADGHRDKRNRLEDNIRIHEAFLEQVAEEKVDAIVDAGDFFEGPTTSPSERIAMTDYIRQALRIAPLFGVKGNHDPAGELYPFNFVSGLHPICLMDRPTLTPGSAVAMTEHLQFLALPWFDKAHLVAGLEATVNATETRARTIAAARQMLTLLGAEAARVKKAGGIPILVGHVLAAGSETATGQTLIGTTVELAPQDLLDVGAAYVALGHIHKSQDWFDGRVAYSGSPQRNNFGEPEPKGWRLITVDTDVPGFFVSNEFRELPARPMELIDTDLTDPALLQAMADYQFGFDKPLAGALVRFRYRIHPSDLHRIDEDRIDRELRRHGAHDVKVEAVLVHESRVRSTEIVTAQTTMEKIRAYWAAKSIEVSDEQAARVEAKLATIEAPAPEVIDAVA